MVSQGALNKDPGAVSTFKGEVDKANGQVNTSLRANTPIPNKIDFGQGSLGDFTAAADLAQKYEALLDGFFVRTSSGFPHLTHEFGLLSGVAEKAAQIYNDGTKTEADAAAIIHQNMDGTG